MESQTIETLNQKIEELQIMVEQLAVSVHQIQRDHPRVDGNRVVPVQPNQLVLEQPPNYHQHEPRDLDERVMRNIKVEAPTFDGRLDPRALSIGFVRWTNSLNDTSCQMIGSPIC